MLTSDAARADTFSGHRASQMAGEFRAFVDLLKREGVRSYLEIGARFGDSFHAAVSALPIGSRGVAVDLPGALWGVESSRTALDAAAADLRAKGYAVNVIYGDSTHQAIVAMIEAMAPFDIVFIDGDHTLKGVSADWRNYGSMARMVAFHDIVGRGQSFRNGLGTVGVATTPVEVPDLWDSLKRTFPHVELVDPGSKMGIGVLWPA